MIVQCRSLILIDSRVSDVEAVLSEANQSNCCSIVFDYYKDTPETLSAKLTRLIYRRRIIREDGVITENDSDEGYGPVDEDEIFHFNSISIIHDSETFSASNATYQLFDKMSPCKILDAETDDPELQSWAQFIELFTGIIATRGVISIDIKTPELNANPNWTYVMRELRNRLGAFVRAVERLDFFSCYSC